MDSLAKILQSAKKPKITVTLFEPDASSGTQVVIIPSEISSLHHVTSSRTFPIRLGLLDNDAVTLKAYSNVLSMVKIIINAIKTLSQREGLTYSARLVIINSGEANILLTITKTL